MRPTKLALALACAAIPTGLGTVALARMVNVDSSAPSFELSGRPVGGSTVAAATAARLTGSRIMAAGEGALVIDADSGNLLRTDKNGERAGQLMIGRDAGLLTFDGTTAFIADRKNDRIAVVTVGNTLEMTRSIKTPAEPFGVALSPDSKTLYVTTIADRQLVAYDAAAGTEKWRTALGREPRGIAISPDGTRGLVAYLTTGTVDQIDLSQHASEHIALTAAVATRRGSNASTGTSFSRGTFAVTYMGDHEAVAAFQRETPVQAMNGMENTGSYGGGFEPPVTHHLAFLGLGNRTIETTAQIAQHQPRALAWDGAHDALYVAGLGNDSVLQVRHASQASIAEGITASIGDSTKLDDNANKCGPDGLAVTNSGSVLVWCSFSRSVRRVDFVDGHGDFTAAVTPTKGPQLVASAMSAKQHEGMVIFHSSSSQMSSRGSMACATCHPDGRADGLSWRIDKHELQTPILAGRMVGTGPFKWDGTDPDLKASMASTMKRLGGTGLDAKQTDALAAYLENMKTVRAPTRATDAVARGKKLFDSAEMGCRSCHDGKTFTDQDRHKFTGGLPQVDTPSLLGLAASAPYFHDGSATTLEALLRDRGGVHGMAATETLNDQQVADLTAFLETL